MSKFGGFVLCLAMLAGCLDGGDIPDDVGVDYAIPLRGHELTPTKGVAEGFAARGVDVIEARAGRGFAPRVHVLIQFNQPGSAATLSQPAESGIVLLEALNNHTWRASVDKKGLAYIETADQIRWADLVKPLYRSEPKFAERQPLGYEIHTSGLIAYRVTFYKDVSFAEVEDLVRRLSGELIDTRRETFELFYSVDIALPQGGLRHLLAEDGVVWVEPPSPPKGSHNLNAGQVSNVNVVQAAPYNLTGANISIGIWDNGAVQAHADLAGRVNVRDGSAVIADHPTHVAGTAAANGTGNANAIGMATQATVESYDWNSDTTELGLNGVSLPFVGVLFPQVTVSNHSYGAIIGWDPACINGFCANRALFGAYTDDSRRFDAVVTDRRIVVVKAAGNERNDADPNPAAPPNFVADCLQNGGVVAQDCIGPMGVAKNVITVGAMNGAGAVTGFTSFGPTDDGRIKPDIVADGQTLTSTVTNQAFDRDGDGVDDFLTTYGAMSGTSQASPVVAGTVALLQEQASRLNRTYRPSSYKALIAQSATDVGNPGPDFQTGWGRLEAQGAADLLRNADGPCLQEINFASSGAQADIPFCVAPNQAVTQVTIAWDDRAAPAGAANPLIHDIDLRLIQPNGTVRQPWTLNPNNPAANAGTGNDATNNVEQVRQANPVSGIWTARVTATRLSLRVRFISGQVVVDETPQRVSVAGVCPIPDVDNDGLADCVDICPSNWDPQQRDLDGDGLGDACDDDDDGDGVPDSVDNCRDVASTDQTDTDGDGRGDVCDADDDGDCVQDVRDNCPLVSNCNYFGAAASKRICKNPCLNERAAQELIGRVFRACVVEPIDPQCLVDGCPWPIFDDVNGPLIRETLDRLNELMGGEPGGFEIMDGGRVRLPVETSGFTDGRLLPPIRDVSVLRPDIPGRPVILCEDLIGIAERELISTLFDTRACHENYRSGAEACQLDSDGDGRGDACDAP